MTHGAGLDIHKALSVATVLMPTDTETRSFGTVTDELLAPGDWLTPRAMEATDVYGKPIYNVLEQFAFPAVPVVNPQQIRGMPGRKTDVQDSQWTAALLRIDVLKARAIPPRPQRELRELAAEANRIPKTLEEASIKLASVISDTLGKSGTRILQALAAGETDPVALAQLADARIRAPHETLAAPSRVSCGRISSHASAGGCNTSRFRTNKSRPSAPKSPRGSPMLTTPSSACKPSPGADVVRRRSFSRTAGRTGNGFPRRRRLCRGRASDRANMKAGAKRTPPRSTQAVPFSAARSWKRRRPRPQRTCISRRFFAGSPPGAANSGRSSLSAPHAPDRAPHSARAGHGVPRSRPELLRRAGPPGRHTPGDPPPRDPGLPSHARTAEAS